MNLKSWLVLAALVLLARQETVCVHATRGEARRISLGDVRRAQAEVRKKLAFAAEKAARLSTDAPFNSGLPSCRRKETRAVRASLPPELVGKSILFAPSDRLGRADFRIATSARKVGEVEADGLAHPAVVERLGVRCAPTLVRVRSEVELELVEDP